MIVKNKNKLKENKEIKTKKTVKAFGKDFPISTKHSIAVCAAIRGKKVKDARIFLKLVMEKKKPVAMKGEIPHRAGLKRPGRYPVKTAKYCEGLLNDLVANADVKNLDTENLLIIKAVANQASRPYRGTRIAYGRKRFKRTHIEFEAESNEVKIKEKKKIKPVEIKKEEKETIKEPETIKKIKTEQPELKQLGKKPEQKIKTEETVEKIEKEK